MPQRILIADDEPLYLRTTGELLRKAGYECVCVPDAHQAIQRLHDEAFDLVLSDLNMPGNLKLELLHEHRRQQSHVPMIVITGVPSVPSAIESIRLGITDYLLKPVKFEDLLHSVKRALANSARSKRVDGSSKRETRPATELPSQFPNIIGSSPPMLELFEVIDRVAATDTNILITGESGTGKEVVAKAIHQHSHRSGGAFQVIDCTAVPESLFESLLFGHKKGAFTGAVNDQPGLLKQCDGGTAFFDELGELPLPLQAKLLRAVQEQTFTPVGSHTPVTVDTRFICATNRDLQLDVNAGRFRQDLFYRLGVIHVDLPALRDRGDDISLLADYFLKRLVPKSSSIAGFTDAAMNCLRRYHWPGNIRELRNVIERTITLTRDDQIDASDLPINVQRGSAALPAVDVTRDERPVPQTDEPLPAADDGDVVAHPGTSREDALKAAEFQYLRVLMQRHSGNVSEAARQAGLSRQGMHKLLKQHNIKAADYR